MDAAQSKADEGMDAAAGQIAALLPPRPSQAISLLLSLAASISVQSGFSERNAQAGLTAAFLRIHELMGKKGMH